MKSILNTGKGTQYILRTNKLILIRGLPGSGKSTYAKKLLKKDMLHYEADTYHIYKDGVYRFKVEKAASAHGWCLDMATTGIEEGHSVIVSNTFTTHREMEPYLDMAKDYKVKVEVIHCAGKFKSVHGVPEDVMSRMEERWEPYPGERVYRPRTKRSACEARKRRG